MESNSEMERCLRIGLSAHGEFELGELVRCLASLGCKKGGERVDDTTEAGEEFELSRSGDGV